MNNKTEIEIKFPLLNGDEVIKKLQEIAKFRYEARQIDEYFNAPHRDFTSQPRVYEWLRLRNSNGKYSVNYKDYSPETYCYEYETEIKSLEDFKCLFKALNFKPLVIVDKTRKVFDFEDTEISIDEVVDLGAYIEIEYKGKSQDIDEVRKSLFTILDVIKAEVGERDRRGYPYELLIKNGKIKH